MTACGGYGLKVRNNYSVSNRDYSFIFLKAEVDAFLMRQADESLEISKLNYSKKFTYFSETDTIDKWAGKRKALFYKSDHLIFSYFYQLEGYNLLQIRTKVDYMGRIDSLDEQFQSDMALVNRIEKHKWDKNFSKVIQIARDSFNLKGQLYCNIYTRDGLWWHIAESRTYRTELGKYRKAVLFNIKAIEQHKLIEMPLSSYND
jgi:hypothetical protein